MSDHSKSVLERFWGKFCHETVQIECRFLGNLDICTIWAHNIHAPGFGPFRGMLHDGTLLGFPRNGHPIGTPHVQYRLPLAWRTLRPQQYHVLIQVFIL